jgi:hypothetical protein
MIPINTGFGTNQRGPKSGQGKLADLDALPQGYSPSPAALKRYHGQHFSAERLTGKRDANTDW